MKFFIPVKACFSFGDQEVNVDAYAVDCWRKSVVTEIMVVLSYLIFEKTCAAYQFENSVVHEVRGVNN